MQEVFIIAEIGQAHDGSLGILHSYIDAVAKTGVSAVKFQTHIAEAESSSLESFRINFSYEDATRQDYWRRMEFSSEQWSGIKDHCDDVGLEFMSTPTCIAAVDLLTRIGVRRFKVGSGDTDNRLLLKRLGAADRQIILSSGLSTLNDLDETVKFVAEFCSDIVVMQCTSDYPVEPGRLGINLIPDFIKRYAPYPVGLSDHSGSIFPSVAAVALGAKFIETHVVFDRRMFGPDSSSSIEIDELQKMIEGVRMVEKSLHSGFDKSTSEGHIRMRGLFGKTLCINKSMRKGDVIKFSDLESKKPAGQGIPARDFDKVVSRRLARDIEQWEFIQVRDLSDY